MKIQKETLTTKKKMRQKVDVDWEINGHGLSLFFRLLNVKILRIKKNREVIIKYFAKFDFCNRKRETLFTRY